MNSRFNLGRWLAVVILGFFLGLLFVFFTLLVYHPRPLERQARLRRETPVAPVSLSEESVRNELIQVIQGQLAAFRKDDYPKAYHFASSSIQEQVPLPSFEKMVRTGFPVIVRSTSAEFGLILDNGHDAVVNVGIVGENGKIIHYRYFLRMELAGWRISAVVRVPFEGTFA